MPILDRISNDLAERAQNQEWDETDDLIRDALVAYYLSCEKELADVL